MIRLSAEAEPEIFATTKRFGTVLENVVMDPVTRELDLDDASLAENSRGAYPIDFIPNSSEENMGPLPKNIVMLTADAFGVLPPIARLTPDQAMYHFLSGYTAKVAGTEIGVTEPEATFSTCFGAPFMPRHPSVYGNLLKERIAKGGGRLLAGQHRLDRRQIWRRQAHADQGNARAAQRRARRQPEERRVPQGPELRLRRAGRGSGRRQRRSSIRAGPGRTRTEYDRTAAKLVDLFVENFAEFAEHVDEGVRQSGPQGRQRAPPATVYARSSDRAPNSKARSMTDYSPRLFTTDAEIVRIGEGLLARTLPRADWTHEAHLAATTYLLTRRPDIDLDARAAGHHPPLQ